MLCSALRSRCLDKKGECLLYFVCRCVFWSALTVAAVWDVREYRIPNGCLAVSLVSGAAAAFGVSGAAFGGMAASSAGGLPFSIVVLSGFLIRFLMVVALGFPVYRWGMIGAGDVKMAAVLAAWLGFKDGAAAISAGFAEPFWLLEKCCVRAVHIRGFFIYPPISGKKFSLEQLDAITNLIGTAEGLSSLWGPVSLQARRP